MTQNLVHQRRGPLTSNSRRIQQVLAQLSLTVSLCTPACLPQGSGGDSSSPVLPPRDMGGQLPPGSIEARDDGGSIDGDEATIDRLALTIEGGQRSNEPMPTPTMDANAPVITDVLFRVDEDSNAFIITVLTQAPVDAPSTLHLEIDGAHYVIDGPDVRPNIVPGWPSFRRDNLTGAVMDDCWYTDPPEINGGCYPGCIEHCTAMWDACFQPPEDEPFDSPITKRELQAECWVACSSVVGLMDECAVFGGGCGFDESEPSAMLIADDVTRLLDHYGSPDALTASFLPDFIAYNGFSGSSYTGHLHMFLDTCPSCDINSVSTGHTAMAFLKNQSNRLQYKAYNDSDLAVLECLAGQQSSSHGDTQSPSATASLICDDFSRLAASTGLAPMNVALSTRSPSGTASVSNLSPATLRVCGDGSSSFIPCD